MAVLSYLLMIMAATGSVMGADVHVCTDKNYGGRCQYWVSAHGSCVTFLAAATWDKKASSIFMGPADSKEKCYFYDGWACDGTRGGPITAGGPISDLTPHTWNDRISSFKCVD
ncbi:hypothetical protein COCC4DRAFT_47708 [Bipolaris maydis ATCC 48331]|uniref:Uncharacterized protein n=2 Tax=Cochliobolus heterostrophus TaxID=5016 RepID=M2UDR1_COCH5|nr:uncharacterized protein COCC4DRAFT_47708 [Bipolaris maydis ATCC 48331]EMD91811.1 hypothetical protein COCHEDRAFT_1224871 [Bipolaris maydis C5]KAJ5027055.1 hypothetical protein J3E73DRAFT_422759 [Bipolaris maydis]ENI08432.1 hypothetical protein COCC4DRAFT_47708 [Bipolaris maydis ATCC 48331]KAJ5059181.1 hypothetical protein J3E74DRAFT_475900 [Bipolaris maydis]KAJ6202759.1 hypothetical protein J3E72DRAFT_381270 [Bipolaris maydis]